MRRTLAAMAMVVASGMVGLPSAGAASPSISEWGKPVGPHGPGLQPAVVQTFDDATAIDAGNGSDLVLRSGGTVWAWGATTVKVPSMTAIQVTPLRDVTQAPVDGNHNFAALEQPGTDPACPGSSTVMTWGRNQDGDLGLGTTQAGIFAPRDVTALDCANVVQLAAAAEHMFALTSSGQVYVWGGGGNLALLAMYGRSGEVPTPTLNPALTSLTGGSSTGVTLTAGSSMGGMLVNGRAYAWGYNRQGQCGCGSKAAFISTPTAVAQGSVAFTSIDEGGDTNINGHTLALTAQGRVWAWGNGAEGQLGPRSGTKDSDFPVPVSGIPPMTVVRAGGEHSMGLDGNGNVWTWGSNQYGQDGHGSAGDHPVPAKVLSGVTMISAGSLHSLAG